MTTKLNFVRQQGFVGATPEVGRDLYPALMWQPRAIAALTLAGLVLQHWAWFLGLRSTTPCGRSRKACPSWARPRLPVAPRRPRPGR
jgi:hypothetical protein